MYNAFFFFQMPTITASRLHFRCKKRKMNAPTSPSSIKNSELLHISNIDIIIQNYWTKTSLILYSNTISLWYLEYKIFLTWSALQESGRTGLSIKFWRFSSKIFKLGDVRHIAHRARKEIAFEVFFCTCFEFSNIKFGKLFFSNWLYS